MTSREEQGRRSTETSTFGVSKRESHDSSAFYARFTPPIISDDDEVGGRPEIEGPICGDGRHMPELPDNSVALVVTSPPYFVGKEYEDEVMMAAKANAPIVTVPGSYGEYLELLHDVFEECRRVLEPGGRVAVNVANLGRRPYRSLSADVIRIMEDLGFLLRGEIIWQKGKTTSGSCAWGSFRTPSNPVLRDTTERIIVASKGRFDRARTQQERRKKGDPHIATLTNDEFVESTIDVWEIPAESARRVGHPAPFPVALPLKLIDLYTYEDDLVLDPFMGSGTTLVAARKARRRAVGYDIDQAYVDMAHMRLDKASQRPRYDGAEPFEPTFPDMPEPLPAEHFQARASQQGKKAQDLARAVLENAGFNVLKKQPKLTKLGIEFNFLVENEQGGRWYVDVSGAFTTVRPGLQRTDTLWKALGRAHVHLVAGDPTIPLLILTSNLPKPASEGWKALKAIGPASVFDAIEILSEEGQKRLHHYGSIDGARPIPGFWTEEEIAAVPREAEI